MIDCGGFIFYFAAIADCGVTLCVYVSHCGSNGPMYSYDVLVYGGVYPIHGPPEDIRNTSQREGSYEIMGVYTYMGSTSISPVQSVVVVHRLVWVMIESTKYVLLKMSMR